MKHSITFSIDYPQIANDVLKPHWQAYKDKQIAIFEDSLVRLFGGYSKIEHTGSYIMYNSGAILKENSLTYVAHDFSDIVYSNLNRLERLILQLKESLYQETILATHEPITAKLY